MEVTNQWIYFGQNWEKHDEKIANSWKSKVNNDDLVVLPGDFSWAMKLEDTKQDFEYLQNLPGKKLLLKGNHDYWWNTLVKMRNFLKENNYNNIDFIQNNYFEFEDKIITGIHGWIINGKEDDEKVLRREKLRLEMELESITKQYEYKKEIIQSINSQIPIRKKEILNVFNEVEKEQDPYERDSIITQGMDSVIFNFYCELIDITEKYIGTHFQSMTIMTTSMKIALSNSMKN